MILKIGWEENESEYEAQINTKTLTVEGAIVRGKLVYNTMADAALTMAGSWDSLAVGQLQEWFYGNTDHASDAWGIVFLYKLATLAAVENQLPKTNNTKVIYNKMYDINNTYKTPELIETGDIIYTTIDGKNPTNAGIVLNAGNTIKFIKSNGINRVEVFEWDAIDTRIYGYSKINYNERSLS